MADFIVERPEEAEEELLEPWTLFMDGSSCINGSRAGLILTNPEGTKFTYSLRFRFDATNNEAEYEALIAGLRSRSKWVPRSENKKADAISKIASTSFAHLTKQVQVEELNGKSINETEVLAVMEEERDTWMTQIYKYLTEETLPVEKEKVRAVRRKSRWYVVISGVLYKKSYLGPWLRCVGPCSMHAGTRSIVAYGCKKDDSRMSRLPGSPPRAKKPTTKTDSHHVPVAILQMGNRHSRTFPGRTWQGTIHSKIGVKICASISALPPSSIHKPMAWWKDYTEAWEME
ncbi:reverse transcriptase domain-containing protein [Tanacetum coccineum]